MTLLKKLLSICLLLACSNTAFAYPMPAPTPTPTPPSAADYFAYYMQLNAVMHGICMETAAKNEEKCVDDRIEYVNGMIAAFNECWTEMNDFYPGQPATVINDICESMTGFNPNNHDLTQLRSDIIALCAARYDDEADACDRNYPH